MICWKVIILIILLIAVQTFAQKGNDFSDAKTDTVKYKIGIDKEYLQHSDSINYDYQVNKDFQKLDFVIPKLNSFDKIQISSDKLASFKNSWARLMELEYQESTKYDLGEVGKYLGISKNVFAIVLAILSLL